MIRRRFLFLPFLLVATLGSAGAGELESIEIRLGDLVFDALASGPEEGELVLLLHGFPQTGYSYRHQLEALGEAGYRAVAPDQRGYSPGARPAEVAAYAMPHLVGDVAGMADALGRETFHLVGHDWGGAVAWVAASLLGERVASLTVLSTPHYLALGEALADAASDQSRRSAYFEDFAAPGAEGGFLADDKARLRRILAGSGVSEADRKVYLEALGTSDSMRAALNWYRALVAARRNGSVAPSGTGPPPRIAAPTLYLWGTEDAAFSRLPAERSASYVSGPYQFHRLEGSGHWLPEETAETVSRLILDHLPGEPSEATRTPPHRGFDPEARLFVSSATPAFELPIPDGFTYLGRLSFPLKETAWVDRHLFAETDGSRLGRMIVLQFEGFLDGVEGAYRFSIPSGEAVAGSNYRFSPEPVRLGAHDYVHNTWAFDQRANATANPGNESDRLLRFVEGRGLVFDDAWIMSRFVRAIGAESRDEVILFYLVPLEPSGHSLAELPDGGPVSSLYDALHARVSERSLEIFRRLEERPE